MMTRQPTADELKRFSNQRHQLELAVLSGARRLDDVCPALQNIIEGKFGQSELIRGMFVPPKVQLSNVRRWNRERGWGFTEADFATADAKIAHWNQLLGGTAPLVLVPYLGGLRGEVTTFCELCAVALPDQSEGIVADIEKHQIGVGLANGITHRPGLRWEVINPFAHRGEKPLEARGPNSAHAGVLALAAHSPEWVQMMDGVDVPFAWLGGYQVVFNGIAGSPYWKYVPTLHRLWDRHEVILSIDPDNLRGQGYAVPVRAEL